MLDVRDRIRPTVTNLPRDLTRGPILAEAMSPPAVPALPVRAWNPWDAAVDLITAVGTYRWGWWSTHGFNVGFAVTAKGGTVALPYPYDGRPVCLLAALSIVSAETSPTPRQAGSMALRSPHVHAVAKQLFRHPGPRWIAAIRVCHWYDTTHRHHPSTATERTIALLRATAAAQTMNDVQV